MGAENLPSAYAPQRRRAGIMPYCEHTTATSPVDPALVAEVLRFARLPADMIPAFVGEPLVLSRYLATPNREMARFIMLAASIGRPAPVMTMPEDRFTPAVNPSKVRLAKLRAEAKSGALHRVTVIEFDEAVGKPFSALTCKDGTPLLQLHNELFAALHGTSAQIIPATRFWDGEAPTGSYPRFLSLFTCLAIQAESYVFERH